MQWPPGWLSTYLFFPLADCPCKRLDTVNSEALKATDECQKYAAFGLGHGVDASEPSPLRDGIGHRRTVRQVLSHNFEKGIKRENHVYEEKIESTISRSHSIKCSVSDLVANVLTFSIEGEYTRQSTLEMEVKGQ